MSNQQNDIIQETAYEAQCEDMRMWAVENQLEELLRENTARKIETKALTQAHKLLSLRLDRMLEAIQQQ